MILNFEELKSKKHISHEIDIDFSKKSVKDALLKRINTVTGIYSAILVENDEVHLNVDVSYNVDYLDARTLEPLKVDFTFKENILFTNDLQKAHELDIDYIEEEILLEELIWELLLVSVPFNYSISKPTLVEKSEDFSQNSQQPFANLFKKK